MQIYISKNNQQLGPFDQEKVLEMLANGQLSANDLGIRHGENQWYPLGVLFPNFNIIGTPSAGFNAHPTTFETSKKVRRRGLGVFMLVLGILLLLGGASTAVMRPTGYKNYCQFAKNTYDEFIVAGEKYQSNKSEENLKDFNFQYDLAKETAKTCEEYTSSYRFWIAVSIITAFVGLLITIIGFFKMR